jgi:hypothetical protein
MKTTAYLKYLIATTVAAHAIGLTTQGLQYAIAPFTLLTLFAVNTLLSLVISLAIFNVLLLRGQEQRLLDNATSILIIAVGGMILGDGFSAPTFGAIQGAVASALFLSLIVNVTAATTVFLVIYIFTESHSYLKKRIIIMLEDQGNALRLRAVDPRGRYAGYDSARGNFITEIPASYFHHGDDGTELLSLPLAVSDFTVIIDGVKAQSTLGSYRLSITTIVNWEVKDVKRIHYLIKQDSVQAYDVKTESDGKIWVNTSNHLPELVERARGAFKESIRSEGLVVRPPEVPFEHASREEE